MRERGVPKNTSEIFRGNIIEPELPIEKVRGCLAASAMFAGKASCGRDSLPRVMSGSVMRALNGVKPERKEILTRSGPFVASVTHVNLLLAPEVTFYCRATDTEEFARLTRAACDGGHIGAKHNVGYGKITGVKIEGAGADWSMERDGVPTRPLPVDRFRGMVNDDAPVAFVTYKCPYWLMEEAVDCYVPPASQYMPGSLDFDKIEDGLSEALGQAAGGQKK